jgi:hypothetical protein
MGHLNLGSLVQLHPMRHTAASDMVGAAERVAKHVTRGQGDRDGSYANLRRLGGCAAYSMAWSLHVPLGSGQAWVEVLKYQLLNHIQATHQESMPCSFEQH